VDFYWLVVGALAVWRVVHLLQAENGPWDFVVRLRRVLGNGFWGQLLDCFHCLSLWIAAPAAWILCREWKGRVFLWLALSGAAILLERACAGRDAPVPPAVFLEDKENDDVMLRRSEKTIPGGDAKPAA
jgi:hypothetical protein